MAQAPIRRRNSTIAVKFETEAGVDAFAGTTPPSALTDFLKADITVAFNQQIIANPELTGTLDNSPSIAGGTKVSITLTCMLKGSGAPGVAPQWGKLMQLCSWNEQVTATAIAAAASTAGSASSTTLGTGYSATAEAYQGMPAVLTGNPATATPTVIVDYSATKVALLSQVFPVALDATTMVAIPANVVYKPISDPSQQKSGTIYIYMDGLLWRFTGCVGAWKADVNAGGIGTLTFTVTGQYNPPVAGTTPLNIAFDAPQPPVFRQGLCRLNGLLARVQKASFDGGGVLIEPENPEAVEGFDPSIITSRASKGSFDPLSSVNDTIARVLAFKQGAPQTAAILYGTVPGNQVAIMSPKVQYTGFTPTNRNDLIAETVPFECNAPNASIFLTVF